jgi:hypothetical protein
VLAGLAVVVCTLSGIGLAPVFAETATPTPSPGRSVDSGPEPLAITSPADNSFVSGTRVNLAGTKNAGTSITVPSLTGGDPLCLVDASASTTWQCTGVVLPSGTIGLVAREYVNGGFVRESAALTLRVLGSPAFTTGGPFVNAGALDGLGWDGASVRVVVSSPTSTTQYCSQTVSDGYWYCGLDPQRFPSGTYRVQVEQSWPGSSTEWSPASAASTLVIDREIPAPPVVTSPSAGAQVTAQPIQFSGTGEADAYIDVYVDNTFVCSTRVSGTSWSCTGSTIAVGNHTITAVQQDAAGNVSSPSAAVAVTIGSPSSAIPAPAATASPSATPTPTPTATALPTPSAAPVVPAPAPGTPSPTASPVPVLPPEGDANAAPPLSWGSPTGYGSEITTPAQTVASNVWPAAVILALGWLLLIAVPLRMLATTLRGRLSLHGPHLTGRNRLSTERREVEEALPAFKTNPYFVSAGTVLGAAVLAVLASGIQNEVRYIRLTVAVAVGLAILNTGAALAIRWAGRARRLAGGPEGGVRLMPLFLAVGAVTAILSRVVGIQPPLVMGIVIGTVFAMGISARDRGAVQLAQIGALTVMATVSWIFLGAAGVAEGFWMSALTEMLAALCLAGFGSAVLLLLPVLSLPGRAIFEWSPLIWVGSTLVVCTLAASMFIGDSFPIGAVAIGAIVVAVLCVSIWGWSRFVQQPAR